MPFFKTTITLEVLSEGEIPSEMDLPQIIEEATTGEFSMIWASTETKLLTEEELVSECERQGSDPGFFLTELD
mgnify:CR=1 FL=1